MTSLPSCKIGGGPTPKLLFKERFRRLSLSNKNKVGRWRPNDNWQQIDNEGYYDFAGKSWNINPNHVSKPPTPFNPSLRGLNLSCTKRNDRREGGILISDSRRVCFKYGYFEAVIRFPNLGDGMFPAFWLYVVNHESIPDEKAGAELDVLEVPGDGKSAEAAAHLLNKNQEGTSVSVAHKELDLKKWHSYGVDWQPEHVRFYYDRELVGELTKEQAMFYTEPMAIRLNYSMDAPWMSKKSNETTPEKLVMKVRKVTVHNIRPW